MNFEPVRNEKIYMLVIGQIKDLIVKGEIAPGDKLPSERVLADALSVSRASVRQAISALAVMGIAEIRHGNGTYIVNADNRDHVLDSFSRLLADEQIAPNEIVETRKMVECFAAGLCAGRVPEPFITELAALIERNRTAAENRDVTLLPQINREFHLAIARGTGNRGIVRLMREVFRMMKQNMWPRLKGMTYRSDERIQDHFRHHEKIFLAIRDHDRKAAEQEMLHHLDTIERELEIDLHLTLGSGKSGTPSR